MIGLSQDWKNYFKEIKKTIKDYIQRDRKQDKEIVCGGFADPMANTINTIGK